MNTTQRHTRPGNGFSLIEVMIAMTILLVSLGALFAMFTVSVGQNANLGEAGTRVTEYAQDKMEQLLALDFDNAAANTASPNYPTPGLGGTGLGGVMAPNTTKGGTTVGSPVAGYRDYLTDAGKLQVAAAGAFYIRQWSITQNATGNMKTITVMVRALKPLGPGAAPSTILICYKSKTT